MMEQRRKEQEEKMQVEIERRLAVTISQITQTGALPEVPLDPVISPSARKSSCASTEVAPSACIEDQVLAQKALKSRGQSKEFQWMTTNNTRWIFSIGAPHVSCTSHSTTSQFRWHTEVLLCIFLDRQATTC
jgi:hypothetical protein